MGHGLHSAAPYPIVRDFSPLRQALGSKEIKVLSPLQGHACSNLQTLLQPETPSPLPAPYPCAFSGDASPFSELMSLRGTAVAWPYCAILHRGHRPFSSLLRYKHVHCGNRIACSFSKSYYSIIRYHGK